MADVDVASQMITRDGLVANYQAGSAADVYHLPNDGHTVLHVKKGANGANLTVRTPGTVDSQAVADRVEAIAAASEEFFGPYSRGDYNDSSDELVFSFSEATGLSFAALRF